MSKQTTETIRIMVADDHPVFRFGLKALLATEESMEIVGEASTGAEAVRLAVECQPDVILMDINMPDMNGIEATRQIIQKRPQTAVLMVTMQDDESVIAAVQAGARGYLLKGSEGEVTLRAIRAVASGEGIFSPGPSERMMRYITSGASANNPFPEMTEREMEILNLLAAGLTNPAIAERLFLSPKTVRNQVSEIYQKLEVTGREEAIVKAREAGLGKR
jgi:DNA-binding NarL/FixJ family response regulator